MTDRYETPLSSRYASDYMLRLFSQDNRYQTWRRLWASLARHEMELGLPHFLKGNSQALESMRLRKGYFLKDPEGGPGIQQVKKSQDWIPQNGIEKGIGKSPSPIADENYGCNENEQINDPRKIPAVSIVIFHVSIISAA